MAAAVSELQIELPMIQFKYEWCIPWIMLAWDSSTLAGRASRSQTIIKARVVPCIIKCFEQVTQCSEVSLGRRR
jgi:hypothetical protein